MPSVAARVVVDVTVSASSGEQTKQKKEFLSVLAWREALIFMD